MKVTPLRTAARRLEVLEGQAELAELLRAIATAHDEMRSLSPVVPLDEALRWSPVVVAAMKFTKGAR